MFHAGINLARDTQKAVWLAGLCCSVLANWWAVIHTANYSFICQKHHQHTHNVVLPIALLCIFFHQDKTFHNIHSWLYRNTWPDSLMSRNGILFLPLISYLPNIWPHSRDLLLNMYRAHQERYIFFLKCDIPQWRTLVSCKSLVGYFSTYTFLMSFSIYVTLQEMW